MGKQLEEIRRAVILKGKRNPVFQEAFKVHRKAGDENYTNMDDIENSGAINLKDAEVLYELVKKHNVKKVFEVGTWFGTSAVAMAEAGAEVWTCDAEDYYVADHPGIKFYKGKSSKILRKLKGMKFDMVFIDGRFKHDDCMRMSRICRIFATHDYEKGKKGQRNIKEMRRRWPKSKLHKPQKGSSIAWLIG